MTDILDIADSDSSENEDINQLFPRCKPKIPSDFNLNKVSKESPTHFQFEKNGNDEMKQNGIPDQNSYATDSIKDDSYEEDRSVVSAYGMFGINCAEEKKDSGDRANASNADLTNSFQEFKLRESRIEIAGGREVYSTNRIRHPRKRINDESINSNASPLDGKQNEEKKGSNRSKYRLDAKNDCDVTSKKLLCQYFDREPEAVVYETQIDGSEVIYDDIGEWADLKLIDDSANSLGKPLSLSNELLSSDEELSSPTLTSGINEREDDGKVSSLIGSLQIAEYEGSPKRYGPRPGHPERIIPDTTNPMEDVIKVEITEENDEELKLVSDKYSKDSSSYVGRRLAYFQTSCVEESPKKSSLSMTDLEKTQLLYTDCYPEGTSLEDCLTKAHLMDKVLLDVLDEDHETISTNPDTEDLGETEMGEQVGQSRNFTLSPETTDCDSNDVESEVSYENEDSVPSDHLCASMPVLEDGLSSGQASDADDIEIDLTQERTEVDNPTALLIKKQISQIEKDITRRACSRKNNSENSEMKELMMEEAASDVNLDFLDPLCQQSNYKKGSVDDVIKEIKQAILKTKTLKTSSTDVSAENDKPVWLPRPLYSQQKLMEEVSGGGKIHKTDEGQEEGEILEECDTDQETDRLLGKQRTDDKGYYEEKGWCKESTVVMSNCTAASEEIESLHESSDVDKNKTRKDKDHRKKGRSKEVLIHEPAVLIEGVLFRARYLGSTQLVCEGQPTKATRMMQAEEAVSRIKAPEGENQPSTEVDLFISTEKIMVLNTDLKEIMMDHSLRTISYIADIGDLVVLMARRRLMNCQDDQESKISRTPKMICHVFESEEAQFIAQSIGQAFQVAYMEFLKANGIEDQSFVKEMDYQEVLNSQEIYGDELEMFAKKEMQKEVIVPKARGEMLGVVIVESGWGSMLPTVVIANLSPSGAAARCGQLNIGDQIIAINGVSLVGLPLSTCQNYIKNAKAQMVVKLTVVPCAPVVEVKIKRPDTKYQLGFSVQNGVICSLLRGGIAERGGVRVGHRIIEINGQSVVAVPHERIVNLLATSVGEILMKTMPTSMFRLLTGQETPVYI